MEFLRRQKTERFKHRLRWLAVLAACALSAPGAHAVVVNDPAVVTGSNAIDPAGSESVDLTAPGATTQTALESITGFGAVQSFSTFEHGSNTIAFSDPARPDLTIVSSGQIGTATRATSGSSALKIYQNAGTITTKSIDFGSFNGTTFDGATNAVRACGFTINNLLLGDRISVRFLNASSAVLSEQIVEINDTSVSATEPTSGEGGGRDVYFGFDSANTGISRVDITVRTGADEVTRGWDDVGFAPLSPVATRYVTPAGSGSKNGLSWENAYPGGTDGAGVAYIARAWGEVGTSGIVYIGSGLYSGTTHQYSLSGGGTSSAPRRIIGVDRGGGFPVFEGDWVKTSPASGRNFLTFASDANHCWVENLVVRKYQLGIRFSGTATRQGFTIRNVDIDEMREGIRMPYDQPISNVLIEDCDLTRFTKRGIRFQGGASQVMVRRCVADAGGIAYATEEWQDGFHVADPTPDKVLANIDRDITFEECTGRNAYNNGGTGYWNGDGFVAEGASSNIRFYRCRAFDNTDGGWDLKTPNVYLEDCIGLRNRRNFRFHGSVTTGVMQNCVSAHATGPAGSGGRAGVWVKGQISVRYSTLHNNSPEVSLDSSTARVVFEDSIVSTTTGAFIANDNGSTSSQVSYVRSIRYKPGVTSGEGSDPNPQLINASNAAWEGVGTDFNSQLYGLTKGYSSTR